MRSFLTVLVLLVLVTDVSAQRRSRRFNQPQQFDNMETAMVGSTVLTTSPAVAPAPYPPGIAGDGKDALAEVNAQRAQRGLRPYLNDPGLNQAAYAAASWRAAHLYAGHVPSAGGDFQFVPAGTTATTAGCAAWTPDWGFGACALYDNYTYCGAAWVMGSDGRRYCHCFYR